MADQSATVSKLRLYRRAGLLSEEDMRKVEEAVKIRLDIYKKAEQDLHQLPAT